MGISRLLFHIARQDGLEFVFKAGTAFRYPMHTHLSVFTITVVRKGMVRLARDAVTREYPPGGMYIIPPHEAHAPSSPDTFDVVSLCIDKQHVRHTERRYLAARFLACARILMQRNHLCAVTVQRLLSGIDSLYDTHAKNTASTGNGGDVSELPAWPGEAIFHGPLPPHLSAYRFIRQFRRETGLTPHQYLVQNRMRKAKELLAAGTPIADAALLAGFYDQSHLNRWFNRRLGITPRRYQNSCFFLDR